MMLPPFSSTYNIPTKMHREETQPPTGPGLRDSFAKAQNINGVSLSSFVLSISTSAIVFITEIVIFMSIRTRLPYIYYVRKNVSANLRVSLLRKLVRFDSNYRGLDRYFFRRYIRTLLTIFLPAALLITPILIPLNYTHGKASTLGVSGIDTLGWSNVGLAHCDRYWAHLILSLVFILHIYWVIWTEFTCYIAIRQKSSYAASRTVLIDCVPKNWMTEATLASQFQLFPGRVVAISFNRDLRPLSRLVTRRDKLLRSLEVAETRYIRRTLRGGIHKKNSKPKSDQIRPSLRSWMFRDLFLQPKSQKVDATLFYHKEVQRVSNEVQIDQGTPEKYPKVPSAFITFDNPLAAHMVCQTVIHTSSGYMTPRMMPVSADDVVWDNISISWWSRNIRLLLGNACIIVLASLCVVPAALIGLLSQIIYVTQAMPWLDWIDDLPEWTLGLLQGILPPILLSVLFKFYSSMLEFLVQKQGIPSKSLISLRVQDFYFYFLFVQSTLIVSLSAGITTIVNEVASGGSLVATLAKNLPKASNYFLSYVLLQAMSVGASALLRIDRLAHIFLLSPILDKTVTEMVIRRTEPEIQWGIFVPVYTNLACIGFLYAIISPIILPIQVLIFFLFWVVFSESSVLSREQDSGGLFYPKALKHLLSGLYLMEISLTTLFLLVRDTQGEMRCLGQAFFMTLTIALTVVYHHFLLKAFDPLLVFTPTSTREKLVENATQSYSFQHTALQSISSIRIPKDEFGIASQIKTELDGIAVFDDVATIDESGRITMQNSDS